MGVHHAGALRMVQVEDDRQRVGAVDGAQHVIIQRSFSAMSMISISATPEHAGKLMVLRASLHCQVICSTFLTKRSRKAALTRSCWVILLLGNTRLILAYGGKLNSAGVVNCVMLVLNDDEVNQLEVVQSGDGVDQGSGLAAAEQAIDGLFFLVLRAG